MSTSLLRVVERAQQDAEQGPEAIQSNGLRRVSAPPTPTGRGPARSAHETLGRTLQLLRSERQPSKSGPSGSRHATGLAQMAAPSQPAHASHVGAVQPIVGTLPASPAAGCRADMGGVATRHISGGAGWWKSPCPVLVRASGEQSPGATRPQQVTHFGTAGQVHPATHPGPSDSGYACGVTPLTLDENITLTESARALMVAEKRVCTMAHGMESRDSTAATRDGSCRKDIDR